MKILTKTVTSIPSKNMFDSSISHFHTVDTVYYSMYVFVIHKLIQYKNYIMFTVIITDTLCNYSSNK
jgi:hypothetical protein